jgi:hypothetical protein
LTANKKLFEVKEKKSFLISTIFALFATGVCTKKEVVEFLINPAIFKVLKK